MRLLRIRVVGSSPFTLLLCFRCKYNLVSGSRRMPLALNETGIRRLHHFSSFQKRGALQPGYLLLKLVLLYNVLDKWNGSAGPFRALVSVPSTKNAASEAHNVCYHSEYPRSGLK